MSKDHAERLEAAVDAGAALLFAAAVAFFLLRIWDAPALGSALAALGFFGCFHALRRVQPGRPCFPIDQFAVHDLAAPAVEELVLTDADRLPAPVVEDPTKELLLDHEAAHVGSDSRVVRLFEPAAMPTPGELKARIDRHLVETSRSAPPDASQALLEALTDLRRSLR